MKITDRTTTKAMLGLLTLALLSTACATKKYVRSGVEDSEQRTQEQLDDMQSQVERTQDLMRERDDELAEDIGETSRLAQDALDRAEAAGKLAQGKLLYEIVLSADKVRFDFDAADLGEEAKTALADFATQLKEENRNIFIEIQGHTDATGEDMYNLQLGEERAEAVRRVLNIEHQIPLHRMSVISYGESEPVADNTTREGRAQNRRVSLVVLL